MLLYLFWFFLSVLICYGTLKSSKKLQIRYVTFFLLALGIFVGLGDMLGGYDRYIYGDLFDGMADVTQAGGNPWTSYSFAFYGGEFGYGTLCALISYITGNRYIFIFIVTMIIYVLLLRSLIQYVDNMPFAVVMFMGLWFFFTFTYLRQVIGCTVIWLSIKYIINRDWKRFLLVWFIGYSFHNSAIIFLPMYFIPVRKFSRQKVLMVMAAAIAIGLTSIPQSLFATYGEIDEERGHESYAMDIGFRWAYLLEAAFFLFVILWNYRNITNKAKDIIMLNTALVFCAILLFFIKSENGGRLGWFFMIGVLCTLSNICIKNKKILSQGVLMFAVCFALFYRILSGWGGMLYPYKTFLTDDVRENDEIWLQYEYDHNYDENKFYRPAIWWAEDWFSGDNNEEEEDWNE